MAMGGGLGGTSGVFANLAARPEAGRRVPGPGEVEGPEWVPEDSQKEGPPVSLIKDHETPGRKRFGVHIRKALAD